MTEWAAGPFFICVLRWFACVLRRRGDDRMLRESLTKLLQPVIEAFAGAVKS